MTSKIVQDLGFEYVKSVVENHSMAILLHTCEGCCEVQTFSIEIKPVNHVNMYLYKEFSYMKAIIHDEGVSSIAGL